MSGQVGGLGEANSTENVEIRKFAGDSVPLAVRLRRILGGALVLVGALLAAACIVAAGQGLKGYLDVASFLGWLFFSGFIVVIGVVIAE